MANGIDLRGFAFGVAGGSVLPPVSGAGRTVAGLPKVGRARLIGNALKHAALLTAFDFPERIASELEVIALLVNRVTAAAID